MRTDWSHLEKHRVASGAYASHKGDHFGAFVIKKPTGVLRLIASGGDETIRWEHVSVSLEDRCPTWAEMSYAKSLFWGPEETVMQLHVPEAEHKNVHPFCLHLFRPINVEIPRPPNFTVA
jgi:hypothetical protein